ncbi:hypothetical protein [Pseudodesulfovibrio karagichevae]|uniref:ANTAR domain-containing protein n=1 Tax=Pseudodesulfovibrio karagichevae TaxID=3239305 RepID=A0ABV4K4L2_9BACT
MDTQTVRVRGRLSAEGCQEQVERAQAEQRAHDQVEALHLLSGVEDRADAYGIFPVMHLKKTLTLHLLSLARRAEEPTIAAMVNLIRTVWS